MRVLPQYGALVKCFDRNSLEPMKEAMTVDEVRGTVLLILHKLAGQQVKSDRQLQRQVNLLCKNSFHTPGGKLSNSPEKVISGPWGAIMITPFKSLMGNHKAFAEFFSKSLIHCLKKASNDL